MFFLVKVIIHYDHPAFTNGLCLLHLHFIACHQESTHAFRVVGNDRLAHIIIKRTIPVRITAEAGNLYSAIKVHLSIFRFNKTADKAFISFSCNAKF